MDSAKRSRVLNQSPRLFKFPKLDNRLPEIDQHLIYVSEALQEFVSVQRLRKVKGRKEEGVSTVESKPSTLKLQKDQDGGYTHSKDLSSESHLNPKRIRGEVREKEQGKDI